MSNKDDSGANPHRLFGNYGELHLLLETDPKVLHEAIRTSDTAQIENVVKVIEDQINDLALTGPSKLDTVSQFMSVWFIATRELDDRNHHTTNLDYNALVRDQHEE